MHKATYAQAAQLPVARLAIGTHHLTAEVAATDATRSRGLMFRDALAHNHGMLFVFDREDAPCFWMKNTLIPLSIAFIDRQGYIINIADMQPHSETPHCPVAPALYALEMTQGWFAERGIGPGGQIRSLTEAGQP